MFANSENLSMMNAIKNVIQKEEYISLAINKYILQTGTIPKNNNNELDWTKLSVEGYLGLNFNKNNPITGADIKVTFDSKNSAFIQGVYENVNKYSTDNNYLYNFYINKIFRVNTIPPVNITKEKLLIGSQVTYNDIQKDIVSLINENNSDKRIKLSSQNCESGKYFYELRNSKLTYKYCKASDISIEVYQEAPIYLEDWEDLQYVRGNIGDKAYAKKNGSWYEYYYQGETAVRWIASGIGDALTGVNDSFDLTDRILSYIPDSKDLVFRRDGGCMLANGDIFCWGNNQYKKAGLESYGQLDKTLTPNYINTPVMLKVQISDIIQKGKNWYNNPYRIKFEKMSMNSTNVCGISPIFDYFDGIQKKFGGDLYCNGKISSSSFEDMDITKNETSILKRNIFFSTGKSDEIENSNEIYLKDIVMVEDVVAVLSDAGKIYTYGRNYQGALGIGKDDKFINQQTPSEVKNSGQVFKKIFALRDIKGFGAIDNNNLFYIWGERPNGKIYTEPTMLNGSIQFNPDAIFTNSKDFILKGANNVFYRTDGDRDFRAITQIPSTAISASIYDNNGKELYLYADKDLVLKGSTELITCRTTTGSLCSNSTETMIFNSALKELNTTSNKINGTDYANFSNVSIYQLDTVKTEQFDDFENGVDTWKLKTYTDTSFRNLTKTETPSVLTASETSPDTANSRVTERVDPTKIIAGQKSGSTYYGVQLGYQALEKTFNFGSQYKNNEVEIELDFYEIDTWDMERFQILLNDELVSEDAFIHDCHDQFTETNDTGIYTLSLGNHYKNDKRVCNDKNSNLYGLQYSRYEDEKYTYKFKGKLDNSGNLKVELRVRNALSGEYGWTTWSYGQAINDESWAIDNVRVKVKETSKTFVCAMTGVGSASQMYCWGNVGRSIPILSTSLYDISKISTINKLFISQESDKTKQMSFDNYNDSGNLFLKYPTYIGGFDYAFYFK
jgi:hypothetical protein